MATPDKKKQTPSQGEGRERTAFLKTRQFDKAVTALGHVHAARVLATAQAFEQAWKSSKTNQDISPGFDFKQLGASPGEYRVCQIRSGSDHRLAVTFLIGGNRAYWAHTWKRTRMNNRTETELAQQRARALWDKLKGKQK